MFEAIEPLTTLPPAPSNLSDVGKHKWTTVGAQLVEQHILTTIDLTALETCCINAEVIAKTLVSMDSLTDSDHDANLFQELSDLVLDLRVLEQQHHSDLMYTHVQ